MRRKGIWLSLLATAMIAGSASAATVVNGNLATGLNWGTNSGVAQAEWRHDLLTLADPDYRSAVGNGDLDTPDRTWPGGGGQNYDAEEIFYYYDDTFAGGYLHVGLLTGFNPNGEASNVSGYPTFYAGDLFIDLGNDGSNDIAVGMGNDGGRAGNAWADSGLGWIEDPVYYNDIPASEPDFSVSSPYRLNLASSNEVDISGDVDFDNTTLFLGTNATPNNQRWFYEVRIFLDPLIFDETLLTDDDFGGIGLHWTMECGNDFIDVQDDTPFVPVVPVPAAAPMALLGMGLLGLVRRFRGTKS